MSVGGGEFYTAIFRRCRTTKGGEKIDGVGTDGAKASGWISNAGEDDVLIGE